MELKNYLSVTEEIQQALKNNKPVVALESTILSHGMPYPENFEFAKNVEKIIRDLGAVPATCAIIDGMLKVGLTEEETLTMCQAKNVGKVSRRDIPVYVAAKKTGATTVASTMILANMAGVRVFATGGIGGVHRGAENTMDISADLQELANTNVAVVCAGAKAILDLGLTLEYLETYGVPVIGLRTDELPAFYSYSSGYKLDYRAESEKEVAEIIKAKFDLGLKGGMVIGNPIPKEYSLDNEEIGKVIDKALQKADELKIKGKNITPFLLAEIKDMTGGESLESNLQLAYNNARAAALIASELCKL